LLRRSETSVWAMCRHEVIVADAKPMEVAHDLVCRFRRFAEDHFGLRCCRSAPTELARIIERHTGNDACVGIETGSMEPWLVHELRTRNLNVICVDARQAQAALQVQLNKTHHNDTNFDETSATG
jgi:hypothetical protein